MKSTQTRNILESIYKRLYTNFGSQNWWPADSPFEVIIGAILTQNTAWSNVEKAIHNLKRQKLLSPHKLKHLPLKRLARLIKPSGYYNIKAKRLKDFISFLFSRYDGSIDKMFTRDFLELRAELLNVRGIGMETADSILLYAGKKLIFVVDAYTRRILSRHNLIEEKATYPEIQNFFMNNLHSSVKLFNEYHALIVKLGKDICKKVPKCHICPLKLLNKEIKHECDSCGRYLDKPRDRYILKIELYASPEVEISEEDFKKNAKREIKELLKQIKELDPKQLEEDVYVSYKLTLCKRCRDIFNKRVRHKEFV